MSEALKYLRESMPYTNLPEFYYENEIADLMEQYAYDEVERYKRGQQKPTNDED